MKKSSPAFIAIGIITCATIGGTLYGTTLTHADTKAQTIKSTATSRPVTTTALSTTPATHSTPTTPLKQMTTAKPSETTLASTPTTTTTSTNPTVATVAAQNFLSLKNPGPIEHYVWNHQGQKDEVWQNTQTGEWRTEKTFPDGSSQKSIFKNGYLYFLAYATDGHLQRAEKVVEPLTYNGKDDAFSGVKVNESSFTNLGKSTISNVPVKILQRADPQISHTTETTQLYIDTMNDLPLLAEHIENGQIIETETWNYSYLQNDDDLFAVPTNVTFQEAPSADTPQGKK